jgi:hypothetical protein
MLNHTVRTLLNSARNNPPLSNFPWMVHPGLPDPAARRPLHFTLNFHRRSQRQGDSFQVANCVSNRARQSPTAPTAADADVPEEPATDESAGASFPALLRLAPATRIILPEAAFFSMLTWTQPPPPSVSTLEER